MHVCVCYGDNREGDRREMVSSGVTSLYFKAGVSPNFLTGVGAIQQDGGTDGEQA